MLNKKINIYNLHEFKSLNENDLFLQEVADDNQRLIDEFEESNIYLQEEDYDNFHFDCMKYDDYADFLFEDEEIKKDDYNELIEGNDDSRMNLSGLNLTYSEWVALFI